MSRAYRSFPRLLLSGGGPLTGTVDIYVVNNGGGGDVFPVCGTTSWGDHAGSGWTIDGWLQNPPGNANYSVPIDVTVPSTPGTYHLFFAARWELTCGDVLSCTNWATPGGNVWDDGNDVADWSYSQAQQAIEQGWVSCDWLGAGGMQTAQVPAAAVRIVVPHDEGGCDPSFDGGRISLLLSTLNGNAVDAAWPECEVGRGEPLTGTINLQAQNYGGEYDVFPVCATPSWGDHSTSGWTVDSWLHNPPGTASYAVPIDLTAPATAGTYYLFFAAGWELSCDNVLSCTNWSTPGGDVWANGHDVADWNAAQAQDAIDRGWVCSAWLGPSGLHERSVPAAAVKIIVTTLVPATPATWGELKSLYR